MWFPLCRLYGMTEEQFWHSNPRIIKVWEKAYKMEQNRQNELIHAWVGNYFMSAVTVAVEHCLNGKKAKSSYVDKPLQLFELTAEEKKREAEKARQRFIAWAGMAESKFKKEGGK